MENQLKAHLVVTWDVDVVDEEDVETVIGVDLGENVIYSLAVIDEKDIQNVELKDGSEFRHNRERLKEKRKEMMAKGDLKGIKKCSGEHEKYTEQVLHSSSREIINEAIKYDNPKIVLEDLTDYRKTAPNAIHDWPYALMQEMISYKAKANGIPVEMIDPRNTSKMCRCCSNVSNSNRNGVEFECDECGYEVHADVNAAMNIAFRGSSFEREEYSIHSETGEFVENGGLFSF